MASAEDPESAEGRMVRAVLRLARQLRRAAADADLTGSGLSLVAALYRGGPMSAVALARAEGLQPQSLSRLLARLERQDFISRAPDPADARRQVIAVTRSGRAALRRAMAQRRVWLTLSMNARLDEAERATLLAATEIILKLADSGTDENGRATRR